jgi:hypothetical protein
MLSKKYELPDKFVATKSVKIAIIEPRTNEEIATYSSKVEVIKRFQMSNTKLNEVMATQEVYKGYRFKPL